MANKGAYEGIEKETERVEGMRGNPSTDIRPDGSHFDRSPSNVVGARVSKDPRFWASFLGLGGTGVPRWRGRTVPKNSE